MKFVETVAELMARFSDANLSPAATRGQCFERASRVCFKKDKGGMYSGRDADGTEALLYFNDTANVISRTEMEPDLGPDEE